VRRDQLISFLAGTRSTLDGTTRSQTLKLIGAHALEKGYSLLTLDDGIYRAAFPKLHIVRV